MTAAPLRGVPGAVSGAVSGGVRGEPLVAGWEPQRQFVGALLWHDATSTAVLLDRVPVTTITDPLTRWVYELIGTLVADGHDPCPPSVLHRAKTQPAAGSLHPDRMPSSRDYHRFANHLAELYTRAVNPSLAADHAHDVLENAYRAAFRASGLRMQHLAETRTDAGELAAAFAAIGAELEEWRRRAGGRGGDSTSRSPSPSASRAATAARGQADSGKCARRSRTG